MTSLMLASYAHSGYASSLNEQTSFASAYVLSVGWPSPCVRVSERVVLSDARAMRHLSFSEQRGMAEALRRSVSIIRAGRLRHA